MDDTPAWGITPVPQRLRVLGLLDQGLLWGNLGVSLLVIVAGAALVPALSLPDAILAIVIGCVIGNLALAAAGAIGADARVPGMVLMSSAIAVRELEKSYGGVQALRGISFEVAQGEVFGLLGPNGAGKTEIRHRQNGELVVVETEEPTRVLHDLTAQALAEGHELDQLEVRRPSLEDVYLELVREESDE